MTVEERDALLESVAEAIEQMVADHPHWSDDEHDGILLAAGKVRGMTTRGKIEDEKLLKRFGFK